MDTVVMPSDGGDALPIDLGAPPIAISHGGVCTECGTVGEDDTAVRCQTCACAFHPACRRMFAVPGSATAWVCVQCRPVRKYKKRRPKKVSSEGDDDDDDSEFTPGRNSSGNNNASNGNNRRRRKSDGGEKALLDEPVVKRKRQKRAHLPPSESVARMRAEDLACPYFQQIKRLALNEGSKVTVPSDPACASYYTSELPDLRNIIKFICKRMKITQTQLAERLNFNNGNMSGTLKGSYTPASHLVYIHTLAQWAYYMDRKFVDTVRQDMAKKLGLPPGEVATAEQLAAEVALDPDLVHSWINFAIPPAAREKIDMAFVHYFEPPAPMTPHKPAKSKTKLVRRRTDGDVDIARISMLEEPTFGPPIDEATAVIFQSWQQTIGDYAQLSISDLQEFVSDDYDTTEILPSERHEVVPLQAFSVFHEASSHDIFINAGGPVTCMAWAPVASSQARPNTQPQYLIVCTQPQRKADDEAGPRPALIQIYDFGVAERDISNNIVRLRLGIVIESVGAVLCAQFCPYNKAFQLDTTPGVARLGLLAVACADGSMQILSIPHPQAISPSLALVKTRAVFRYASPESSVYTLRWHPTNAETNYPVILAGTHQGNVLLWDIRTGSTTPEQCIGVSRTVNDCVTCVTWCSKFPVQFAVASHSGIVRLYDLRSPFICLWSYDCFRPVYGLEPIFNGEGYAIAMATGFRYLGAPTQSGSTPLFWQDLPFEGVSALSVSTVPLDKEQLLMTIATDNGCALIVVLDNGVVSKKVGNKRLVQIRSTMVLRNPSQSSTTHRRVIEYGSLSHLAFMEKTARANQDVRETLRKALPRPPHSEALLNKDLCLTACAFNSNLSLARALFASGGHAGVVRVQQADVVPSS